MSDDSLGKIAMRQWELTWNGPGVPAPHGVYDHCELTKRDKAWEDAATVITAPLLKKIAELEKELAKYPKDFDLHSPSICSGNCTWSYAEYGALCPWSRGRCIGARKTEELRLIKIVDDRGLKMITTMKPLQDYVDACGDIGPLAAQWADKPHRHIYDLVNRVKELERILELREMHTANETLNNNRERVAINTGNGVKGLRAAIYGMQDDTILIDCEASPAVESLWLDNPDSSGFWWYKPNCEPHIPHRSVVCEVDYLVDRVLSVSWCGYDDSWFPGYGILDGKWKKVPHE